MKIVFTSIMLLACFAQAEDSMMKGLGAKALEKTKTVATDVMSACKNDQVKFCKETQGAENIKACLKSNYEKLTPTCKQALPKK
jgi:hypothetical protein